jgi:hypothetical protein
MSEGSSLQIGNALRGGVVQQSRVGRPAASMASLNAGYLGEYPHREMAKGRVESDIEHQMNLAVHEWEQ